MCGIAGLIAPSLDGPLVVRGMLDRMRHRGPDGEGVTALGDGATFGHLRLAVVGLGEGGGQPMHLNGRTITYNGEIYNHRQLRDRLEREGSAPAWRGRSDTETLLAAIAAWGLEETLAVVDGMFAFALWDERDHSLVLVRDRMGEKPLYFGWIGQAFVFASELNAMSAVPGWRPRLEPSAADTFLRHGFVIGMPSLVQGIHRLPPGTLLRVTADARHTVPEPSEPERLLRNYWQIDEIAQSGMSHSIATQDAARELETLLLRSVSDRMTAEVPIGAFLSGGVDSSLVTALMQSVSDKPIHSFSIGFDDPRLDESAYARAVAEHLGTEHTEFRVRADDALEVATSLPFWLDEPIADASQLPMILLARLARTKVTVALSGDGADELFAGYGRYKAIHDTWSHVGGYPLAPRRFAARLTRGLVGRPGLSGRGARWTARTANPTLDAMRLAYIGSESRLHLRPPGTRYKKRDNRLSQLRQIMLADQQDFLPDDILQKVDRATMRYALESRTPFLDHRVVSFSWRLTDDALPLTGPSKPLLRSILRRYVPDALINRPKQGFDPPMRDWLSGPLASWIDAALRLPQVEDIQGLDAARVQLMWKRHRERRADFSRELWPVALLASWMDAHGVRC